VLEVKRADLRALTRLEAIREADPGLPVILVSAVGGAIWRIVRLRVEGWIDKPFRLEELRASVRKVLRWEDGEE